MCYECGDHFKTVHELMKHRKKVHTVPVCKNYLKGSCGFSDGDCYYTHNKRTQIKTPQGETLGFWDPPSNMAPPSRDLRKPMGPTKSDLDQMKNMVMQLNQMVAKFL